MKTYHGSCFCGAVAFEADGDLAEGTMRCDCSFCRKMRYWEMRLPDPDGLRITRGADVLAETPRKDDADLHHVFCPCCGTRLWTTGDIGAMGGRIAQVCVSALDDVPEEELVAAPVWYADGARDDWWSEAAETRHL